MNVDAAAAAWGLWNILWLSCRLHQTLSDSTDFLLQRVPYLFLQAHVLVLPLLFRQFATNCLFLSAAVVDSTTTVEIATKICFAVQVRLNPRRRNSSQLAEGSWSDASTPRLQRIASARLHRVASAAVPQLRGLYHRRVWRTWRAKLRRTWRALLRRSWRALLLRIDDYRLL